MLRTRQHLHLHCADPAYSPRLSTDLLLTQDGSSKTLLCFPQTLQNNEKTELASTDLTLTSDSHSPLCWASYRKEPVSEVCERQKHPCYIPNCADFFSSTQFTSQPFQYISTHTWFSQIISTQLSKKCVPELDNHWALCSSHAHPWPRSFQAVRCVSSSSAQPRCSVQYSMQTAWHKMGPSLRTEQALGAHSAGVHMADPEVGAVGLSPLSLPCVGMRNLLLPDNTFPNRNSDFLGQGEKEKPNLKDLVSGPSSNAVLSILHEILGIQFSTYRKYQITKIKIVFHHLRIKNDCRLLSLEYQSDRPTTGSSVCQNSAQHSCEESSDQDKASTEDTQAQFCICSLHVCMANTK